VIVNPFMEVVELSGGDLLLNAAGGAGGVGARLRSPEATLEPGARATFKLLVGLPETGTVHVFCEYVWGATDVECFGECASVILTTSDEKQLDWRRKLNAVALFQKSPIFLLTPPYCWL
jgi:hypothetical protein